jgi:dipeptidyl aminopeptidase/acylaminoacyl peptidase
MFTQTPLLGLDMAGMSVDDYIARIAEAHGPNGHTVTAEGALVYSAYRGGGYELVSEAEGVLTETEGDLTSPDWLDGRGTILALIDEGGSEQHDIVEVEAETGSVRFLTDDDQDDIKVLQNPADPGQLAFISTRDGSLDLYTLRIDTDDAEPVKQSTTDEPIWAFDWSPAGDRIVYQAGLTEGSGLRIVDIQNETDSTFIDEPDSEQALAFVGGGHHAWGEEGIVFTTNHTTGYREVAVGTPEGSIDVIQEDERDKYDARWVPDDRIAFLAAEQGDYVLQVYEEGTLETVESTGLNLGLEASETGVFYQHLDTNTVGDIHRDGEQVLAEGQVDLQTVAPEKCHYQSFDGTEIPALLFSPEDAPADTAIVRAHGGPEGQHFNSLNSVDQTLVREGHAILAPDVRGSIGYGRAFRKASDGDLGGADLQDLVAAADYLRDEGYDRVGLTGGSYGGYMTLMGVGATDAFDAGAAVCGVVNWETVVEDARGFVGAELMRKLGGTPDERPEFYAERSPITHVDEITVPLLVVQGANDPRVPQSEAEQIIDSLADRDVPHEYLLFEDEGHGVRLTDNRIEYISRMASFFDAHL